MLYYTVKVSVVKDVDLFEVSRSLDAIYQFLPLAFKYIDLEILIKIVDQETHVLTKL